MLVQAIVTPTMGLVHRPAGSRGVGAKAGLTPVIGAGNTIGVGLSVAPQRGAEH